MSDILQKEHPLLRARAREVTAQEFNSPELLAIIDDMKKTLAKQDDGVAIAAPQVGHSIRMFVISKKVFTRKRKDQPTDDVVCINPIITKLSQEKKPMLEGCLSVRWLYGNVLRSTKASLIAYNERGEKFTMGASGLIAQIFQHEVDHLDGVLFIDKATDVEDVPPEKVLGKKAVQDAQVAEHEI